MICARFAATLITATFRSQLFLLSNPRRVGSLAARFHHQSPAASILKQRQTCCRVSRCGGRSTTERGPAALQTRLSPDFFFSAARHLSRFACRSCSLSPSEQELTDGKDAFAHNKDGFLMSCFDRFLCQNSFLFLHAGYLKLWPCSIFIHTYNAHLQGQT